MLLPPNLACGIDDAPNNIIEQPQDRYPSSFPDFFRSLQTFDQMKAQKTMPKLGALPSSLRRTRRGQDDTTFTTDPVQLPVHRLNVARHSFNLQSLGSHAAGKAAVQHDQKSP